MPSGSVKATLSTCHQGSGSRYSFTCRTSRKRWVTVTRQNLAIALGRAGLLVVGVLAGEVHMAGGMLLHQASVLLVILSALRLSRKPRERTEAPRVVGCLLAERGWCPGHQG